jgi:Rrf2 family nitric oxide-sensitive transcriptional repressor
VDLSIQGVKVQLTRYTDYSLRVLIYLSWVNEKNVTITEIADFYDISRNHLVKVVHRLAQLGFIITMQGKGGGIKLARAPEEIVIGEVVRKTEPNFHMVECFDTENNQCLITSTCRLRGIFAKGTEAFFKVLDSYTLVDCGASPFVK